MCNTFVSIYNGYQINNKENIRPRRGFFFPVIEPVHWDSAWRRHCLPSQSHPVSSRHKFVQSLHFVNTEELLLLSPVSFSDSENRALYRLLTHIEDLSLFTQVALVHVADAIEGLCHCMVTSYRRYTSSLMHGFSMCMVGLRWVVMFPLLKHNLKNLYESAKSQSLHRSQKTAAPRYF